MSIPREREDQKLLLRGLMNVRVPKKINPRFLQIQDEYLRAEMEEKNILFKEKNQLFYRRRMAKIQQLKEAIEKADAVVIGAGAGLSTSAGFVYTGERFSKYFGDLRENMDLRICTQADFIHLILWRNIGGTGADIFILTDI